MSDLRTILIADDESAMRQTLHELLSEEGYTLIEAADGAAAVTLARSSNPALVLLDINLPRLDGLAALREIKQSLPECVVIVFTAYGTGERAIEAMKAGAYDYLEKPFDLDEFLLIVRRAMHYRELIGEVSRLRSEMSSREPTSEDGAIVGSGGKMQEIFKLIGRTAPTDATVLIQGESGTGKELIADAIQRHSLRRDKPFIKINCGALPETLLESEIFGHEKGAFTGAVAQRLGRFELAHGGTIFLDEVNTMPPSLQVKVLRVLQNGTFERVGGKDTLQVDVRVIAATNKELEKEVASGNFREDLYYRLNILHIRVPPLREHPEDIPVLVEHFLRKHGRGRTPVLSSEVLQVFRDYSWPGNVREMENVIQRALVMAQGEVVTPDNIPLILRTEEVLLPPAKQTEKIIPMKQILADVEKQLILRALHAADWNRTQAAEMLGIHRRQLFSRMQTYRIRQPSPHRKTP